MIKPQAAVAQQLGMDLLTRAANTYKVLSHPVRLRIVELLMEEQLAVCEIAERLETPAASISQHLNLLRTNGVVEGDRRGNKIFYRVVSPQAICMIECLREHGDKI
jgi:ArsR family transcriptional regulator